MEDDLNLFCKMKMTVICFVNGRQHQFILLMEDDLNFFKLNMKFLCKWKKFSIDLLMEDALNFLVNGLAMLA